MKQQKQYTSNQNNIKSERIKSIIFLYFSFLLSDQHVMALIPKMTGEAALINFHSISFYRFHLFTRETITDQHMTQCKPHLGAGIHSMTERKE